MLRFNGMAGFYTGKFRVTAAFASGWPGVVESSGMTVDAEPMKLGGELNQPVYTGVVYWRRGGVWFTVGAPFRAAPDPSRLRLIDSSHCALDNGCCEYFVALLECRMPTFWSSLIRPGRDSDSKECFDKLMKLFRTNGFLELRPGQFIDRSGNAVDLLEDVRATPPRSTGLGVTGPDPVKNS
jgi:hypothetical protein